MKTFLAFVFWCILFVLCWPVALAALVLFPIVWLILLPFRLIWVGLEGVLALFKAIIFLPARLLGSRPHS
ncbi:MAG: hypothetical protein U1G07_05390 [Verrucomicrobiota bacterium]